MMPVPPPDMGAVRCDPDGPRAGALAREGLRHSLIVSPRRRQITLALALHPHRNIRGPEVLRFLPP
jgi:hypothetical protein